jgi:colanic acid biosynthesis glycosyl transferase WcaI
MRVVLCCMYYAPDHTGLAPFTTGVAEHLSRSGHTVEVVAAMPHYPQWRFPEEYGRHWWVDERRNGIRVRRWRVPLPARRSAVGRITYDSSIALFTLFTLPRILRADVLISVSPPIQLPLVMGLVAKVIGARHVTYVQDLPVDLAESVGMLRSRRLLAFAHALERLAYRFSWRVVSISPGFTDALRRAGVDPDRLVTIPNWGDSTEASPKQATAWRARLGAGVSDFLAVYAGNMGEKQDLDTIIDVAAAARIPGLRVGIVGDGAARSAILGKVTGAAVTNVRLEPLQSREQVPSIFAAADVLLLTQRADVIDSVAPSKLLSYMAAGRPVIAAVHPDSETARLVSSSGCGIVCKPEDFEELVSALRTLRSDDGLRQSMGERGRKRAADDFSEPRVLKQWQDLVMEAKIERDNSAEATPGLPSG